MHGIKHFRRVLQTQSVPSLYCVYNTCEFICIENGEKLCACVHMHTHIHTLENSVKWACLCIWLTITVNNIVIVWGKQVNAVSPFFSIWLFVVVIATVVAVVVAVAAAARIWVSWINYETAFYSWINGHRCHLCCRATTLLIDFPPLERWASEFSEFSCCSYNTEAYVYENAIHPYKLWITFENAMHTHTHSQINFDNLTRNQVQNNMHSIENVCCYIDWRKKSGASKSSQFNSTVDIEIRQVGNFIIKLHFGFLSFELVAKSISCLKWKILTTAQRILCHCDHHHRHNHHHHRHHYCGYIMQQYIHIWAYFHQRKSENIATFTARSLSDEEKKPRGFPSIYAGTHTHTHYTARNICI